MKSYLKFSVFVMILVAAITMSTILQYQEIFNNRDGSSYIARIYFMNKYGYFQNAPNWNHGYGYTSFLFYPPLFAFFSIPFFIITGSVLYAYMGIMVIFSVAAIALIYVLRYMAGLGKLQSLFLGLFFFFNPIAISRFYRTVRVSEQLGWLFLIVGFFLILYYKERKTDRKFFCLYGIISALTMLSHTANFILLTFALMGFFLYKRREDWIPISGAFVLGMVLSSFWWVPFIINEGDYLLSTEQFMNNTVLGSFPKNMLFASISFIIPLIAIVFMYMHIRNCRRGRELLFLVPLSIPVLLFLFRLTPYIPIINRMGTGFFFLYPVLLGAYYMLKTKYDSKSDRILGVGVLVISVFVLVFTSMFYSSMEKVDFRSCDEYGMAQKFFPEINGTYEILPISGYCRYTAIAYATVFYDLNTTGNWHPEATPKSLEAKRLKLFSAIDNRNCSKVNELLNELRIEYLIGRDGQCDALKHCLSTMPDTYEDFCMYRV